MDLAPMLLICTPIFLPVIATFGIDPVHFGMIMILNLGIGLLTPPVGPTLVVGCAIGKVSMEAVSQEHHDLLHPDADRARCSSPTSRRCRCGCHRCCWGNSALKDQLGTSLV